MDPLRNENIQLKNVLEKYLQIIDQLRAENDKLKRTNTQLEDNNQGLFSQYKQLSSRGGVDMTIENLRRQLREERYKWDYCESQRAELTAKVEELTKELHQSLEESRILDEQLADAEIKLTEMGSKTRRIEANLVNKLVIH